jgi:PD-(D/E)XK endonuclease
VQVVIVRTYTPAETDVIAAYCLGTGGCYVLRPEEFSGRRTVYLRVAPSLNNQQSGINWAEDFSLEARLTALLGP